MRVQRSLHIGMPYIWYFLCVCRTAHWQFVFRVYGVQSGYTNNPPSSLPTHFAGLFVEIQAKFVTRTRLCVCVLGVFNFMWNSGKEFSNGVDLGVDWNGMQFRGRNERNEILYAFYKALYLCSFVGKLCQICALKDVKLDSQNFFEYNKF